MEWLKKILSIVLFSMLNGSLAYGGLTINSMPYSTVLKPGSNTTLECTVSGKAFNPFFNQIIWYKHIADHVEIQINTGGIINFPFRKTDRFGVKPEMIFEKNEIVMPLTITGITVADDGTYTCQLKDLAGVVDTVNYTVRVPEAIRELILVTNATEENANNTLVTYLFEELQPTHVSCISVGGNPSPTLRMYKGMENITSEFTRKTKTTRVGEKGVELVINVVEITTRDFQVDPLDSGKILTCLAEMWEVHPLTTSTSAAIKVHYAPKFFCETSRATVFYSKNYQLQCKVKANPPVNLGDVYWTVDGPNGTNITIGETLDGFTANATVYDEYTINVYLTIAIINSTTNQTYDLHASNDLGSQHIRMEIYEEFESSSTDIITNSIPSDFTSSEEQPTTKEPAEHGVPGKVPVKVASASVDHVTITMTTCLLLPIIARLLFG